MWKKLPLIEREEYKKMILAFASLTEMFAQKADDQDKVPVPVLNSKYQETAFKKVFGATEEDIGNTAYDAAMIKYDPSGDEIKYLIGLKTFGYASDAQKVAQFKANHNEWADIITQIKQNSVDDLGHTKTKQEIDIINRDLYLKMAERIAELRNLRIDSAVANLRGFKVAVDVDNVESVYHVLMPAVSDGKPRIYVGETPYDKIQTDRIKIKGCTTTNNATNFTFTDGKHEYRFTSADSQLLMMFRNSNIVQEKWDVTYAEDAYKIFSEISEKIASESKDVIIESHSWKLTNKKGEVELYSGFNSFYGVGSKLAKDERQKRIDAVRRQFSAQVKPATLTSVCSLLNQYLLSGNNNAESRKEKIKMRDRIVEYLNFTDNEDFTSYVTKLIYRPMNETYIPIPNAKRFHEEYPDFFAPDAGKTVEGSESLALDKADRQFNLVFEPSGDTIRSYISQDSGKAIESVDKQSILGVWMLRQVFQLNEYEPLTKKRLDELNINGIRLYKTRKNNDVHLEFIWIDDDNLPDDYMKTRN